jgi:hypothetical protein
MSYDDEMLELLSEDNATPTPPRRGLEYLPRDALGRIVEFAESPVKTRAMLRRTSPKLLVDMDGPELEWSLRGIRASFTPARILANLDSILRDAPRITNLEIVRDASNAEELAAVESVLMECNIHELTLTNAPGVVGIMSAITRKRRNNLVTLRLMGTNFVPGVSGDEFAKVLRLSPYLTTLIIRRPIPFRIELGRRPSSRTIAHASAIAAALRLNTSVIALDLGGGLDW